MNKLLLALSAVLALAAAPEPANAAFTLTLSQTGGSVVVNGSGTLNTTALTLAGTGSFPGQIAPAAANLISGPSSGVAVNEFGGGGFTGPTSFGIGGSQEDTTGTGATVGVLGGQHFLIVPTTYVSGTALTTSSTFNIATFASLNFTPGTYTYTWGTGANTDSLVITSVVPEPSTWALFIAGGLSLLGVAFRRRRA